MRLVFDIETDGLDSPSKLHCVCCVDIDTGEKFEFFGDVEAYSPALVDLFDRAKLLIGHNIIEYDLKWLQQFVPELVIHKDKVVDTLVLSRLLWQARPGGHSLEAWGQRLGYPKPPISDFSEFTPELLARCHADVEINAKLYHRLMKKLGAPNWELSVKTELEYQWIAREMHENGFVFNIEDAVAMLQELDKKVEDLDDKIQKAFPPVVKITELKTIRSNFKLEDDRCLLKIPSVNKSITSSITDLIVKLLKDEHPNIMNKIVSVRKNDESGTITITKNTTEKEADSTIEITWNVLDSKSASLLTDFFLKSMIECTIPRAVAVQFVEDTKNSWSITVTPTDMFVDFSVVNATYILDGMKPSERLLNAISRKTKIEEVPFNPASPKQLVDRLWDGGWKPVEKTKGHAQALKDKNISEERLAHFKRYGWKVNEANVETLPDGAAPEYQLLVERLLTDARRRTLTEWLTNYNPKTGRIHGKFNPLGTRTQRCVHTSPNMGNVPTKKSIKYNSKHLRDLALEYGGRMRSMWICDADKEEGKEYCLAFIKEDQQTHTVSTQETTNLRNDNQTPKVSTEKIETEDLNGSMESPSKIMREWLKSKEVDVFSVIEKAKNSLSITVIPTGTSVDSYVDNVIHSLAGTRIGNIQFISTSVQTTTIESFLCGCDMESAHLRIFAHLINDPVFIDALVNGKKEDGTDPHSVNKRALGDICLDRDRAKTFIFTFLNGGGAGKVREIFACSNHAAKEALDRFVSAYPGLKSLREERIPRDASRGYFQGIDGRLVINDSAHHMIGFYLQNMESVLMKHAQVEMFKRFKAEGFNVLLVGFVHDEVVLEVRGSKQDAERVGVIAADCIRWVGERFNLNCPLSGEWKVGKTWLQIH